MSLTTRDVVDTRKRGRRQGRPRLCSRSSQWGLLEPAIERLTLPLFGPNATGVVVCGLWQCELFKPLAERKGGPARQRKLRSPYHPRMQGG